MAIEAAEVVRGISPEMADSKIAAAGERMRESLKVIRKSVRMIDSRDSTITIEDLARTLSICIYHFEMDTGIRISSNLDDFLESVRGKSISAEHARFLYGAIQECLSNSVRHGKADAINIQMLYDNDFIEVEVADNGTHRKGAIKENGGFGLKKIEAYLNSRNGSLQCIDENGFTVKIRLPKGGLN